MGNSIVNEARNRFDAELHTEEYKKIHSDDAHLQSLLQLFEIRDAGKYFDLGTGNGYVAFEAAKQYPKCSFTGIDIANESIAKNNTIAEETGMKNIRFISYDGIELPFMNEFFDGGVSRYAMHHFPDINKSIAELNRVLKINGFFILSDPKTYDEDINGFIDSYQKMNPDGHVHFYREGEIDASFANKGFVKEKSFISHVTYPRIYDENYQSLLASEHAELLEKYKIRIEDNLIYITVECMNSFYRKISNIG